MPEPTVEIFVIEEKNYPRYQLILVDAADYARAKYGTGTSVELIGVKAELDLKNTYWTFSFKITARPSE